MLQGKIESIFVYPVKGCAGISVSSSTVIPSGLVHDRQWMVVNEKNIMVTQRVNPALALIQPSFNSEKNNLSLRHPDLGHIDIPLANQTANDDSGSHSEHNLRVKIWKDEVDAFHVSDDVNAWLTDALKSHQALKLVRFNREKVREPGKPERFGKTAKHFADAAPVLVANTASLDALNQKLISEGHSPLDMRSFRPNIVVSGLAAFTEHNISNISFDKHTGLELIDHCERCVVITINPDTAQKHPQQLPFKELADLNSMPNNPRAPAFGVNACLKSCTSEVTIRIKQAVTFK